MPRSVSPDAASPLPTIVAVPARLASSRLPGKVMADIGGQPMLRRVLERCAAAETPAAVVLCTDSPELVDAAAGWGFPALLTGADCPSGSDRIASVVQTLLTMADTGTAPLSAETTLVINVQGDQPFLDPAVIDAMAAEFGRRRPLPEVLTPVYRLSAAKVHNPNVVKTLLAADGRALYFSRSAIPHVRDVEPADWPDHAPYWGHVGLYGYRADVLAGWAALPHSPLEQVEKLEQLRLIEAGIGIGTFPVEGDSLSVDTAEQLEQARGIAAQMNAAGGPVAQDIAVQSLRSRHPSAQS
ncbi:3-deoxy-manno-octulosonate cytidylyltransferase [Synechococcus sp. CCY9201]|uniref:3-deoxy-manno-octulosonate cytidylyltransferase n=1 Tax=unclassified Synechococcus TaxID=2626047 RepID=UPI001E5C1723|nr:MULTISPECIES: 3-deoxy-manno-octulosonate cytidylyltransferase [unclassified Synechococcus]MEA5423633.1 3-deoxy-manno-octulosonate cytidylyltransferase [Synechococcus sp. CCY9202]MEA5473445.1 3-deoxy-manno-octulosonate cytidylyltransferase [Synechococcus sp. CCY9201]